MEIKDKYIEVIYIINSMRMLENDLYYIKPGLHVELNNQLLKAAADLERELSVIRSEV